MQPALAPGDPLGDRGILGIASATAELQKLVTDFFHSLDTGDTAALTAASDSETAILFDTDENNKPVALYTPADVHGYLQHAGELTKSGMKIQSKVTRSDCHGSQVFGFCAVEFEQSFTAPGAKEAMGPFKLRSTMVARKTGGAWKFVHAHGSLAEAPAAAPAK